MNFNLDALIQPISENKACGEDLSFSNEFHEIKQAKTQDDVLLAQGDWVSEPKQADWPFVANKSIELLTHKTKDIRLLTWLTEAWSHLYGFEGIEKSLELSHRLLEQYWLKIHPMIEDDDLDQRLGLLQGLTHQLPTLIKQVALVQSQPCYSLADYENFLHQQNTKRKHSEDTGLNEKIIELEQFEQALAMTSKNFQQENYAKFENIFLHWERIKQVLDLLMELEAPSFAHIDSTLAELRLSLKKIYRIENTIQTQHAPTIESPLFENLQQTETQMPTQALAQQYVFQPSAQNHLQNREQAIKLLQEVADYFQINEPHSPVSYMLEKTIKWSNMPLHEWLAQVIKNDHPLESVQELLGMQNTSNESNGW